MSTSALAERERASVAQQAYAIPRLTNADFSYICRVAYRYCGLDIRPGKEGLVQSRLAKLMRQLKIDSFREYRNYLEKNNDEQALSAMVDCLTTNHTAFFREEQHFRFLASTILPEIENRQQIDIWSAACSTGEEPYSLAIGLLEYFEQRGRLAPHIRILATDISNRALAAAKRAVYPAEKISHLPPEMVRRYMLRGRGASKHLYRVKGVVRELVHLQRLNLMEPFEHVGEFPLILCRNAMIYFDEATQERLIARFHERLERGGHFFVGHSESLNRIRQPLRYIRPAIYRRCGELSQESIATR